MKHRLFWGGLFIIVNFIALIIMINSGELIGDVYGIPVTNYENLIKTSTIVILTYILVIFLLPLFLSRLKLPKIKFKEDLVASRISILMLCLQIGFIIFNFSNGVNVAGSGNQRTDSVFSLFWIFFPVDLLFIIYYASYRDQKLFGVNLLVAVISSLSRGRSDIFLLIVFFESALLFKSGKLTFLKVYLLFSIGIVFYPLIVALKFAFRIYFGSSDSSGNFILVSELGKSIEENGIYGFIFTGLEHFISRIQVVSIASEIERFSSILSNSLSRGDFYPFWMEGFPGLIVDRLIGQDKHYPLGVFFTKVGDFSWSFNVGDWNTNPSLASWFFIEPLWSGFLILYVMFFCFLTFFLSSLINRGVLRNEMIFYSWLIFLLPGWLGVFFSFCYSLFVFLMMKALMNSIPKFRWHN